MNNKEFVTELAKRLETSQKEVSTKIETFGNILGNTLMESDQLIVYGFGSFEMVSKKERLILHPSSGKKMLVPPKRAILFKVSNTLKDKIKNITVE